MQVTDRIIDGKHIVYESSFYSNSDYIIKKDCIKCNNCNLCIFDTYIYLNKITDKYKYVDINVFKCPCPSLILKYIPDKTLHSMILQYLL